MSKQRELFSTKEDPIAARCADKLVNLYDNQKELTTALEKQEIKMTEIMR